MIKEVNISLLKQSIQTLESSFEEFEKTYEKKDAEKFNEIKRTFIQTQKKILEAMK